MLYALPPFKIVKSPYPIGQPAHLEKITSVRGRGRPTQRNQASKAPTGPSSNMSDNRDNKNPLRSNKLGPSEASARPKALSRPETPARSPQALPLPVLQDPGANRYSQQDLDRIIQIFLYASKGRSGARLKAKTLDVYRMGSYMECYNFYQQCEDYFATCGVIGPN